MAFDFIKGTDQVQERTRGGITGFFRIKEFSPYMGPAPGMFKRQIIITRIHVANNRSAIILKEFFRRFSGSGIGEMEHRQGRTDGGHFQPEKRGFAFAVSRDQQPDRRFVAMDDFAPVNDDAHPVIQRRQEFGSFRKQMLQGGTVDHQALPVHDFRLTIQRKVVFHFVNGDPGDEADVIFGFSVFLPETVSGSTRGLHAFQRIFRIGIFRPLDHFHIITARVAGQTFTDFITDAFHPFGFRFRIGNDLFFSRKIRRDFAPAVYLTFFPLMFTNGFRALCLRLFPGASFESGKAGDFIRPRQDLLGFLTEQLPFEPVKLPLQILCFLLQRMVTIRQQCVLIQQYRNLTIRLIQRCYIFLIHNAR